MFTELLPVLKDRMVTLIIARLDETLLRVIVVPQRKSDKENNAAENALSMPLTVTGTAEELDRELAHQMRSFSGSYERAACNIREIENAHAAAVKAADEEKKNAKGKKPSATPVKAATGAESDSQAPARENWSSATRHKLRLLRQRSRCSTPSLARSMNKQSVWKRMGQEKNRQAKAARADAAASQRRKRG